MYLEDSDATNSLHALPSMHEDGIKIKAHKLSILKALLNDRSQLSVSIQGIPSVFATIILAIDTKNEWLELDELVDNTAHAALLLSLIHISEPTRPY